MLKKSQKSIIKEEKNSDSSDRPIEVVTKKMTNLLNSIAGFNKVD